MRMETTPPHSTFYGIGWTSSAITLSEFQNILFFGRPPNLFHALAIIAITNALVASYAHISFVQTMFLSSNHSLASILYIDANGLLTYPIWASIEGIMLLPSFGSSRHHVLSFTIALLILGVVFRQRTIQNLITLSLHLQLR